MTNQLSEMGKYATVVIDPPWSTGGFWSRQTDGSGHGPGEHRDHEYPTMPDVEIAAMDIRSTMLPDAWLFLWTTTAKLPTAIDTLRAWQVDYAFMMTWHKHFGPKPSQRPTYNAEYILVGKQGKPSFLTTRGFDIAVCWPHERRADVHPNGWGHAVYANSGKPEGFYDLLRRVTSGPRLGHIWPATYCRV